MNKKYLYTILIWSTIPTVLYNIFLAFRHYILGKEKTSLGFIIPIILVSIILGTHFAKIKWTKKWNYGTTYLTCVLISILSPVINLLLFLIIPNLDTDKPHSIIYAGLAYVFLFSLLSLIISIFFKKPVKIEKSIKSKDILDN